MTLTEKKHLEILRGLGTAGRLCAAFELHEFAWSRLSAHLRGRHPEWTREQLDRAVRERMMRIR